MANEELEKWYEWTAVRDEEPEQPDEYFITWRGNYRQTPTPRFISICEWDGEQWDTGDIEKVGYRNIEVIAWMHLPQAYSGEVDD